MSKLKNEADLVKQALKVGEVYVNKRGFGTIEESDSANDKVEFIYRALVRDQLIQPLAKDQLSHPNMRHKLALWIERQLPDEHPLKN